MVKPVNHNLNLLKGFFIILVIVGHVIIVQDSLLGNLRTIIYMFHMPAFIVISGYFIHSNYSIANLFKKYFLRILFPWVLASVTYEYLISPVSFENLPILVGLITYPYYHLWYILAFLFWVLLSFVLDKLKISLPLQLVFSLIFSFFLHIEFSELNSLGFSGMEESQYGWFKFLSTYRPFLFYFLILGKYFRKNATYSQKNSIISALLGLILAAISYNYKFDLSIRIILIYSFNSLFLYSLTTIAKNEILPRSQVLEWIGKNSLPIYLWHILAIISIDRLFEIPSDWIKMGGYSLGCVIIIITIYFLSKLRIVNKILFGNY